MKNLNKIMISFSLGRSCKKNEMDIKIIISNTNTNNTTNNDNKK